MTRQLNRIFKKRGLPAELPLTSIIAGLWKNNEQGVWYDASDLSTMFQDAAGTLPVYAPGSGQTDPPVGRILDKSGRGNHAYQATTTSRPTLSARYNLLEGTESLSTQSVAVVATAYTLTTTGPGSVTLSGAGGGTYTAGSRIVTCTAGTLTLTVSGSVTQADLRPANDGVGLPPYQRVTDASNYDTPGFPLYLRFDGVDDWLQTASVDFSGTGNVFLAAAMRKLSDVARGLVLELGSSAETKVGNFSLEAPSASLQNVAVRASGSSSLNTVRVESVSAPVSTCISAKLESSFGVSMRLNSGAWGATAVAFGGNFSSAAIYIGRRSGASIPFNGRLYSLLIRGTATPDTTIAKVERYLNQKAKVF